MNDRALLFAFVGRQRTMRTQEGVATPPGLVWDFTAYPTRFNVLADTPEDAIANLQDMVEQALAETGTPDAWYASEFDRLTTSELTLLKEVVGLSAKAGKVKSRKAIQFAAARDEEHELLPT